MSSPQQLPALLNAINSCGHPTPSPAARLDCQRFVAKLRLVHRGAEDETAVRALLGSGVLQRSEKLKQVEKDASLPRSLFFFLGAAAYPDGVMLFVVHPDVSTSNATFTPFDTGCISPEINLAKPAGQGPWSRQERCAFLLKHCGAGADLIPFAENYIAMHFDDPYEYSLRGQLSRPNQPLYHELQCFPHDRRAWTLEVRLNEDLSLESEHIERIFVEQQDIATEYAGNVRTITHDKLGDLAQACMNWMFR